MEIQRLKDGGHSGIQIEEPAAALGRAESGTRKKDKRKKRKRSSSSDAYSSSSSHSRSKRKRKTREYSEPAEVKTVVEQVIVKDDSAEIELKNTIAELNERLEQRRIQYQADVDSYKTQIEELNVTIEELNTEIEKQESAAEKEAQENSLAGKMSAVVNQARYKAQVEELKERDKLQKEEWARQVQAYLTQVAEAEAKMIDLLQKNESQIKKAE